MWCPIPDKHLILGVTPRQTGRFLEECLLAVLFAREAQPNCKRQSMLILCRREEVLCDRSGKDCFLENAAGAALHANCTVQKLRHPFTSGRFQVPATHDLARVPDVVLHLHGPVQHCGPHSDVQARRGRGRPRRFPRRTPRCKPSRAVTYPSFPTTSRSGPASSISSPDTSMYKPSRAVTSPLPSQPFR